MVLEIGRSLLQQQKKSGLLEQEGLGARPPLPTHQPIHPDFGRSVNPISTGGQIMPTTSIFAPSPGFSDFPTALQQQNDVLIFVCGKGIVNYEALKIRALLTDWLCCFVYTPPTFFVCTRICLIHYKYFEMPLLICHQPALTSPIKHFFLLFLTRKVQFYQNLICVSIIKHIYLF